jgi:hypothetical protein
MAEGGRVFGSLGGDKLELDPRREAKVKVDPRREAKFNIDPRREAKGE